MIRVTIPLKTVSEANQRGHWGPGAKRKQEHRGVAKLVIEKALRDAGVLTERWTFSPSNFANGAPMLTGGGIRIHWSGAIITLTRIAPRALDDDNLCSAFKAIRDGIADAFHTDDRKGRLEWKYTQERGKPKEYAVRVEIGPR
jgi:hypothetical protein